ncbi:HPF/RaiA family ribosome-associated protein [Bergeyella sp. RCAD1439]|uniref:HPF/RaiA family ribosome-associated protein n=1 Tax=Bergeyella anatis TaxID=3113737 RepID=UPI002E1703B5|nr:HPF/RaiA family ribosome-associated protein [Bergeyella sp. RCAD1439]
MDIIINTDNQVEFTQKDKDFYREELQNNLKRFEEYLTRYEVFFSDESSNKDTPGDQKCVIEARIKGRNPERVSHNASERKAAFDGAVSKMRTVLDRVVAQMRPY